MGFLWRWIGLWVLCIGFCMFSVAVISDYLIIGFISWPTDELRITWIIWSIVMAWIGSIMVVLTSDWRGK
jgi:hypothetical protein